MICAGLLLAACISRGEPLDFREQETAEASILPVGRPPAVDASLAPAQAHSVTGVNPSSGPFKGGVRAIVRGTGFTSDAQIWFGANRVPASDTVPIDPTRVQVTIPAGQPGPVDVVAQNADDRSTRATLRSGFVYDPFYAEPSSGPTSGSRASGARWMAICGMFFALTAD